MPVMWPQFRPLMLRPTIASVTGKSRATDLCDSPFLQRATIFKTSALVSFFPGSLDLSRVLPYPRASARSGSSVARGDSRCSHSGLQSSLTCFSLSSRSDHRRDIRSLVQSHTVALV